VATTQTNPLTDSPRQTPRRLEDSPIAVGLFGDVRWAWIWLILRLYVGYDMFNLYMVSRIPLQAQSVMVI
jgi:hypothetical protein